MTPPLARSAVDRAAHRRLAADWLAAAWRAARVLVVDTVGGGTALVTGPGAAGAGDADADAAGDPAGRPELVLLSAAEAPQTAPEERLFLGVGADGVAVFAVDAPLPERLGARAATLRDVGHVLDDRDTGLFSAALALANWHAGHRFSPASGQPTRPVEGGWARAEPGGGHFWPRTDPAIITLVHDGVAGPEGRCLLGRSPLWRRPGVRRFSCLAGFVEAGESAEAAVVREVREEVGVEVSGIAYAGSQPWPFPASLMLAFTAYADPAQPVVVDVTEIAEARWFTRREVAAVYAGQRVDLGDGDELALPANASVAAYLVARWAAE